MYRIALTLASLWILLLFLPPWLMAAGQFTSALPGYQVFSVICHQLPERSWHSFGFPLAVCSRCAAIYVGGLVGLLMYPLAVGVVGRQDYAGRSRRWLLLSLLPMLIDVMLDWSGLVRNTFVTRTLTGLIVGVAAALHLYYLIVESVADWHPAGSQRSSPTGSPDRTGDKYYDQ